MTRVGVARLGVIARLAALSPFIWLAIAAPAAAVEAQPATLRLAQVVSRLPRVHLYAIAQDEDGGAVAIQPGALSVQIGTRSLPVTTGRDDGIGVVLLVDVSRSLNPQQFELVKASLLAWIDSLRPIDRAAIVTFGSRVATVQNFTADRKALAASVGRLAATDTQTLLYQGLVQAIGLSHRLDAALPIRRAIVVLTDGLDDQEGGAGRDEVLGQLEADPVPIYGIGTASRQNAVALKNFSGLVRASGGDFRRVGDAATMDLAYRDLRALVGATQHLVATCSDCPADGGRVAVRLLLATDAANLASQSVTARALGGDGRAAAAGDIKPTSTSTPTPAENDRWWKHIFVNLNIDTKWLVAIALLAGGATAGTVAVLNQKPKDPDKPPTQPTSDESNLTFITFDVHSNKVIPPGTNRDKRRLRLFPLGGNELAPKDLLFETELTIGRDPKNDICVDNDPRVSGKHCILSVAEGRILVRDAGSLNGTRVNGVPINGFIHAESDSILGIGGTDMRMRLVPEGAV